jgi:hypothetical protein
VVRGVQEGEVTAEAVAEQGDLVASGQLEDPVDPGGDVVVD